MDRPPPGVKTGKPESGGAILLMGNRSFETAPQNPFTHPAPTPASGLTDFSSSLREKNPETSTQTLRLRNSSLRAL